MTAFFTCRKCGQTTMAFKLGKSWRFATHRTSDVGNTCDGSNRKP